MNDPITFAHENISCSKKLLWENSLSFCKKLILKIYSSAFPKTVVFVDDAERSSGNLFMKEIKEVGYYCKCFENELFCINILKNGGAT